MTLRWKIGTILLEKKETEVRRRRKEITVAEILDGNNESFEETEIESTIVTLTDLEDGSEHEFEMIGEGELDGNHYYALVPLDEESDEYYIFRGIEDENGEITFETIEDDNEFDAVEEYFNDLLFSDVDYDEGK